VNIIEEISARLLERLDYMRLDPERIAVLGPDAHSNAAHLRKRYPKAAIITETPEEKASIDLIFSNLALYRALAVGETLQSLARALKPTGLLLFTTLGPDTFKELGLSHDAFFDMHDIGDALIHCELMEPVMDMEYLQLNYASLEKLRDDLNLFGLGCNVQAAVDQATIELIYGHAWGSPEKNTAGLNEYGEVVVPVDTIRVADSSSN